MNALAARESEEFEKRRKREAEIERAREQKGTGNSRRRKKGRDRWPETFKFRLKEETGDKLEIPGIPNAKSEERT